MGLIADGLPQAQWQQHCLQCGRIVPSCRCRDRASAQTIVVGVADSNSTRDALTFAVAEAKRRSATLRVVSAWQPAAFLSSPGLFAFSTPGRTEAIATQSLEKALAELNDEIASVALEKVIRVGFPVPVLLSEAETASLLVVGATREKRFAELIHGSVGRACASYSRCPVVIVGPTGVLRDRR